jgi:hypothetical protein
VFSKTRQISLIFKDFVPDDPDCLTNRLPETVVKRCIDIVSQSQKAGRRPTGVCIQGYGSFNEDGLCTLKKVL